MLTITETDFQRLVRFVKQNYGIDLSKKKQLILGRLSNTILSMGFPSFQAYVDHLIRNQKPEDLELMLNKLTTNYTYFMREESHFEFFTDVILPYLLRTLCFRRRTIYHFNDFKRISRIKSIHVGYPRPCDRYFPECIESRSQRGI